MCRIAVEVFTYHYTPRTKVLHEVVNEHMRRYGHMQTSSNLVLF